MNRSLARYGLVLVLLALVTGMAVQSLSIPRLGLSAHTIGLLGGTLLIALAAIWSLFSLGPRLEKIVFYGWIYAVYSNWLGCVVGAASGAGRVTPIAADGATGSGAAEAAVGFLLISGSLVAFAAIGLSLWGLRGR